MMETSTPLVVPRATIAVAHWPVTAAHSGAGAVLSVPPGARDNEEPGILINCRHYLDD